MVAMKVAICVIVTALAATQSEAQTSSPTTAPPIHSAAPTTPPPIRGCYVGHNVDFNGNDIGNLRAPASDQCCSLCARRPGCNAWTWTNHEGGTCWLKSRASDTISINVGADSCKMNMDRTASVPFKDCDMPGNDLYSAPVSNIGLCGHYCSLDKACKAVTWTSGTCYFKYDVRECIFKAGVSSSVAFNRFVGF